MQKLRKERFTKERGAGERCGKKWKRVRGGRQGVREREREREMWEKRKVRDLGRKVETPYPNPGNWCDHRGWRKEGKTEEKDKQGLGSHPSYPGKLKFNPYHFRGDTPQLNHSTVPHIIQHNYHTLNSTYSLLYSYKDAIYSTPQGLPVLLLLLSLQSHLSLTFLVPKRFNNFV